MPGIITSEELGAEAPAILRQGSACPYLSVVLVGTLRAFTAAANSKPSLSSCFLCLVWESRGTSLGFVKWLFIGCFSFCFLAGFQAIAGRFFFFMLALVMVSYTATAMSLAISAGMEVVAVANLLITICFVLMLVSTACKGVCCSGGGNSFQRTDFFFFTIHTERTVSCTKTALSMLRIHSPVPHQPRACNLIVAVVKDLPLPDYNHRHNSMKR